MEFWTAVAVLRRRWYVFVPGLVLTMVAALGLAGQVKPTYKASGTVRLEVPASDPTTAGGTPSTTLPGQTGSNPIADIDRFQALNLLAQVADDSVFRDRVVANGGSANFTVAPPFANTPSLSFSTVAATPERAMADYQVLIKTFSDEVDEQQAGSPAYSFLKVKENTTPANAFAQNGARTKGVIMVGIIGLLLSLGASFLVDSISAARRRRRQDDDTTGELVTLAPIRSPLDELDDLVELPSPDDPDTHGSLRRSTDLPASESSSRATGRLGGNPTRW